MRGDPGTYQAAFANHVDRGVALLRTGRPNDAISVLKAAQARAIARFGEGHDRVTEIVGLLAVAHALSGDRQTAHGLFRQSVPLILNRSANANIGDVSAEIRGIRLRLILESYLDFLTANSSSPLIRQTRIDAVGEAFLISQAIRAQSVQSAVSSSGARAAAGTPELADLVRREQDMKQQIVTLYGSLANAYSGGSDAAADTIRERIDVLLSAHSALLNEVNTRFPDYAEFTNPKPLTIAAVQNQLSAGQALVSFYAGEKTTYIWAVPKMGPVSFATSDGGRETLQVAIRELRRALYQRSLIRTHAPICACRGT